MTVPTGNQHWGCRDFVEKNPGQAMGNPQGDLLNAIRTFWYGTSPRDLVTTRSRQHMEALQRLNGCRLAMRA